MIELLLGLIVIGVMALAMSLAPTYFLMLFLGNIGVNLSYLAILPGVLAVHLAVTRPTVVNKTA